MNDPSKEELTSAVADAAKTPRATVKHTGEAKLNEPVADETIRASIPT